MSTKFIPLTLPPGVVAAATKKMQSTNYAEVNMVRWADGQLPPAGGGQLSPIGGQTKYNFSFASVCKRIHGFYDLNLVYNVAYLCEAHLYIDRGGVLTDITPVGGIAPPQPPDEGGYGDGFYNTGPPDTYGTPRDIGSDVAIDRVPDAYSLQNFGAILLAMTSADGRLLFWDPADIGSVAGPVVATAGVVPLGHCFVVTSERFVQIFGSYQDGTVDGVAGGSFRRFAWCEQEDYTNWSYEDVTTQAGFIDIEPSSPILCAVATRTGTLYWTAKKCYRSRYLGEPYIYSNDELADNCTPWSPQSMVTTTSMVLWFSQQGPYSYDGTSILPVQCTVRAWIDDDIDLLNVRATAHAVHVANFNEFWWFFPQQLSSLGTPYPTRAVIYNYKEGFWGQARCARTAGVTASYTSHTIMANGVVAYEHENGFFYWDCDLPWAETFDINVGSGKLVTLKQLIPDVEGAIPNVLYSLFYRNSRSVGLPEQQTTPRQVRSNGYVDFRTTGRDMRLRIDLAAPAGTVVNGQVFDGSVRPVTVGQHLIDFVMRGDR